MLFIRFYFIILNFINYYIMYICKGLYLKNKYIIIYIFKKYMIKLKFGIINKSGCKCVLLVFLI